MSKKVGKLKESCVKVMIVRSCKLRNKGCNNTLINVCMNVSIAGKWTIN